MSIGDTVRIESADNAPETSFRGISRSLALELEPLGWRSSVPSGQVLIREGEPGKGVYLLHSGSARLIMAREPGNPITLRTMNAGSFIGLSATLTCDHYCYSVETLEPSQVTFVEAGVAQEFLRCHPELCLQVVQVLGQEMSTLCAERAVTNTRKLTKIGPKKDG